MSIAKVEIVAEDKTKSAFMQAKSNLASLADASGKASGSMERFLKLSPQMMALGAATAAVGLAFHDVYKASGDLQKGASALGDGWSRLMATLADTAMIKAAGSALEWLGDKLTEFSNFIGGKTEYGQQQQMSTREWEEILRKSEANFNQMKKAEEDSKREFTKRIEQQKKVDDDLLAQVFKAAPQSKEEALFNLRNKKKELGGKGSLQQKETDFGPVSPPEDELKLRQDALRDSLEKEYEIQASMGDAMVEQWRRIEREKTVATEQEEAMRIKAKENAMNSVASILGSLSALVDGKSKKQFELSKNLARAETIISTYAAAQKAYEWGAKFGGPVGGAAAASAAVLQGLVRLKQINSTSFNSSGGASGVGGGGSAGSGGQGNFGTSPISAPVKQEPQQILQIQFTGNVYGMKDFENSVIEAVKTATDKDVVIISQNTAQAREIMRA